MIARLRTLFYENVWCESPDEFEDLPWYNYCGLPFRGTDDRGRWCLTWGLGFIGFVTVAYRKCSCADCHEIRAQTLRFQRAEAEREERYNMLEARYGKDMADDWLGYQLRMQSVPREGSPRV